MTETESQLRVVLGQLKVAVNNVHYALENLSKIEDLPVYLSVLARRIDDSQINDLTLEIEQLFKQMGRERKTFYKFQDGVVDGHVYSTIEDLTSKELTIDLKEVILYHSTLSSLYIPKKIVIRDYKSFVLVVVNFGGTDYKKFTFLKKDKSFKVRTVSASECRLLKEFVREFAED